MRFCGRSFLPHVVSLLAFLTLTAIPSPAAGQGAKRVLLLFDEDRTLPGVSALERSIRSTLSAELGSNVEFFVESMHAAQFPEEQHLLTLRDYYRKVYGSRKLDLIVGVFGPVVKFLLQHSDSFAPGVPIVFCGADARDLEGVTLPVNMTGLILRRTFAPTLDIALRLHPDTQQVFVVSGTSAFDRHLAAAARRELEQFAGRVSITYLTDLPMKDLLSAVANIPSRSVILPVTVFRDGAGQTFVPHDVVSQLSAAARAPVYVFLDQYLGLGPVGGYLYTVELHGKEAAELGLRLLRGESPADIPVREVVNNQFMFDARQLRRWGLDSRLLPAGSVLEFSEPSAWDRYRWYVIAAIVVLTVQTGLIVGLLVQRTRRRRAESELRASVARIREMGGRVLSAQETERTRIARELHDDISQQLALLTLELHGLAGMMKGRAAATVAGEAVKSADDIATSIRNLSHRLYPVRLQLIGLLPALEGLVGELSHYGRCVTFTHEDMPSNLSPDLALGVFRLVQEALQNALKHSQANTISVHVSGDSSGIVLTVVDDGVGFVVERVAHQGLGLISMRDRVEAMGGNFTVWSVPQGGTRLTITVPVAMAENPGAIAV